MTLASRSRAPGSNELVGACIAFIAGIAIIDLMTANINLSILYCLPVLVLSQTRGQLELQVSVVAAVVLTYVGYILGPRPQSSAGAVLTMPEMLTDWRMFNRTLSVIALCGIGGMSLLEKRFHLALERRRAELDATDADGRIYEEILHLFNQMTAVVVSVVIIAVVAVADFITPAQYNLPILIDPSIGVGCNTTCLSSTACRW